MSVHPYAAVRFLTGSAFSATDTESATWVNVQAVVPGSGLWNRLPPALSNPRPPHSLSNPRPPHSFSNPRPPHQPRLVPPEPTTAPLPRVGLDPDWVFAESASLLGQALARSAARIARPADRAVTAAQAQAAGATGAMAQGSSLWRWAPEFRAKTVAGELMSRFQVLDRALFLVPPVKPGQAQTAQQVFALPASMNAAGVNLNEQIDKVIRAATEREDRLPEILSQTEDFWPFFESIIGLSLDRAPRTAELLAATHDAMLHIVMQLKQDCAALRPVQVSTLITPLIPTPGHGSMPSGHATMAAYTSELMHLLLYAGPAAPQHQLRTEQMDRLARRIAFNRVVAGLHFPVDSQAGYRLGTLMAQLTAALAGVGPMPSALDAAAAVDGPFELKEIGYDSSDRPSPPPATNPTADPAPLLGLLWEQAGLELQQLRV